MLAISVVGTIAAIVIAFPFVGIGDDSNQVDPVAHPVASDSIATSLPPAVVMARSDATELRMPVVRERITAFVFRAVDNPAARELRPGDGIDYHVAKIAGSSGPATAGLDIGAPAGTPVYPPVDGTITSVSDYRVAGRVEGYEILIEPSRGSSVAVRVSQLSPFDGQNPPEIGRKVSAGAEPPIGRVHDLAGIAELPVGRYTSDAGNSVHLEVLATGDIPVG